MITKLNRLKGDGTIFLVALFTTVVSITSWHFDLAAIFVPVVATVLALFLIFMAVWHPRLFTLTFIFLIPLSVPLGGGGHLLSLPSEGIMLLIGGVMIWRLLLEGKPGLKILRHPISILLLLEMSWMILTALNSTMPLVSAKRVIMKVFFFTAFYLYAQQYFNRPGDIFHFFLAYAAGCIIPVFNALFNHLQWGFSMGASYSVTLPFFPEHTMYAACLSFALIMVIGYLALFNGRSKPVFNYNSVVIIMLILFVGIYFSFSRAAWLSLVVALITFLVIWFRVNKSWVMGGTALLLLIGISQWDGIYDSVERNDAISTKGDLTEHVQSLGNISSDASNAERLNRWYSAFRMFQEKPLLGFGPGTYQFQYGVYQAEEDLTHISTYDGDAGNAHSEYLNVLTETGLPGLTLFLILIGYALSTAIRLQKSGDREIRITAIALLLALVSYFVHGLVNAFIEVDKAAVLVYGAFGGLVYLDHISGEKSRTT